MVFDVAGLKARLARGTSPVFPVYGDDGTGREEAAQTAAAVLVPIVDHPGGLTVLFTQRTMRLKSHAGQVSFPGGRAEPGDPSPEFTALREAEEEIGIRPERIEIIGRLPDYLTRTGYRISPIVGLLTPPLELVPDPREVDEVFEVPLAFLLDPRNHRRSTREFQGKVLGFYEMPYRYDAGERHIWGATAGMLVNLYRHLLPEDPA